MMRAAMDKPRVMRLLRTIILTATLAVSAAAQDTAFQDNVVFYLYAPQSDNHELLRRVLTPMAWQQAQMQLDHGGQNLQPQSIDLAKERFGLYVPPGPPPPKGYALIVYVPPWEEAALPKDYAPVLDAHHMIFVTAAHSDNTQNVITRREPLAVLAAINVMHRYAVDPARVYVGGMSGGSRVAMRLALAWPDIFDGAFLNAGSDPIGDAAIPIPPADVFRRFQENTRLYYATGARDTGNLRLDVTSMSAMRDFCIFNTAQNIAPNVTHKVAAAEVFSEALDYLDAPPSTDAARLASCRAAIDADIRAKEDAIAKGGSDADALRLDLNNRYGGLSARAN
jgi:hypothetical protein